MDCSRTTPTPRTLLGAPDYYPDSLNPNPGSGFLQFWTVSAVFRLDKPTRKPSQKDRQGSGVRAGIFGKTGRQVGELYVDVEWAKSHGPGEHEFILLCEGRVTRPKSGREDEEKGWKYMVMLLEWHADGQWATRVTIGAIDKDKLDHALGQGPVWKEIVLG